MPPTERNASSATRERNRWIDVTHAALLVGAATLFAIGAEHGCSGPARDGSVITVAAEKGSSIARLLRDDLLPAFESSTNGRARLILVAADSLPSTLLAVRGPASSAGLLVADAFDLAALVHNGLVGDLTDYRGLVPQDTPANLVAGGEFDDRLYFLPMAADVRVSVWTVPGFQLHGLVPPKTWNHLEETARAFREVDGEPRVAFGCDSRFDLACDVVEMIRSAGGDPLALDDEASEKTFAFLRELWPSIAPPESTSVPDAWNANEASTCRRLADDEVYLARCWASQAAALAAQRAEGEVRIYRGWRAPAQIANLLAGYWLAIPVTGESVERSLPLVEFLLSPGAQRTIAERSTLLPAGLESAVGMPRLDERSQEAIVEALEEASPPPRVLDWPAYERTVWSIIEDAFVRGEPIEQVLSGHRAALDSLAGTRTQGM